MSPYPSMASLPRTPRRRRARWAAVSPVAVVAIALAGQACGGKSVEGASGNVPLGFATPAHPPEYASEPDAEAGATAALASVAAPCQSDDACGLHRCDTALGRCAFPCRSAADCRSATQCVLGVCLAPEDASTRVPLGTADASAR